MQKLSNYCHGKTPARDMRRISPNWETPNSLARSTDLESLQTRILTKTRPRSESRDALSVYRASIKVNTGDFRTAAFPKSHQPRPNYKCHDLSNLHRFTTILDLIQLM